MTVGLDKAISQLDAAAALAGTELMECVQGGDNVKTTPAAIKSYIGDAVPTGVGQNDGLLTHEDKAKLDGIEDSASADQSAQEIATAIGEDGTALDTLKSAIGEASAGFEEDPGASGLMSASDKSKLDGVEPSADVNQIVFHGIENRADSYFSQDGTVLSLNVPPVGGVSVWLNGKEYPLTESLSVDLGEVPDIGLHFIAAVVSQGAVALQVLGGPWNIRDTGATPIAMEYWNGTLGAIMDERHGHNRNLGMHEYLHKTVGARIQNDGSFAQVRPTTTNDGQLELVAGSLWDEDIENEISTAKGKLVRNWYETASGVWTWANGTANSGYDRPYLWNSGTSLLRYPNTGSAYALTDVASNRYIAVWVYASNDVDRPIYVVTPALATTYTTVANARAATAPVLPFAPELKLLYRFIYRGDGEYQEAADYRTASSLPSGGVSAPVAASVTFSPSGNIAATNVQAAIEELDTEKLASTSLQLAIFTPLDNQPPATAFATLDTRNSIAVLDFDDGATNEGAVFVGVIPSNADLSSGIAVRIFWMATSATSGNVRWGVQFEKYGTDSDSDSFDTATEAHTATSGTSGIAVMTAITATTIDSLAAGDLFRMKIYRDSSDTTNDTASGDAELIAVELRQVA